MNKFPHDVKTAEELTNGDVDILSKIENSPAKKLNYSVIFGDQTKKTNKKGAGGGKGGNQNNQSHRGRKRKTYSNSLSFTIRKTASETSSCTTKQQKVCTTIKI